MSIHFSADTDTVDTIYRIILSVNQLSIYGAVAAICDEYDDQPDSMGEPVILEGQSIVLGKIKAEVPVQDKGMKMPKFLCKIISNKSIRFHQKTNWRNFVRKQDL